MQIFHKLKYILKENLRRIFKFTNLAVIPFKTLENFELKVQVLTGEIEQLKRDLNFVKAIGTEHRDFVISWLSESRSQLRQDLFVLTQTGIRAGYFVEFGATDGLSLSNTFLLEKEFSWKGILAEPARIWEKELRINRPRAIIETLCVWKKSNETMLFNEVSVPELSTLSDFTQADNHRKWRNKSRSYTVKTISLHDLLEKNKAPYRIDFLSIDTEGSEFEILDAFDFDKYLIAIIAVEHNYTEKREAIFDLLSSKGYKRVLSEVSYWDDWYIMTEDNKVRK